MKKYEFRLEGLDCANCANKIQNKLSENKDYKNVIVNFNTLKLSFETQKEVLDEDIEKIINLLEPDVKVINLKESKKFNRKDEQHHHKLSDECKHNHEHNSEHNSSNTYRGKYHNKKNLNIIRVLIGIILVIAISTLKLSQNIRLLVLIVAYAILLYRTTKNSIKLLKKKTFDENFLVTVSCIGALLIGEELEGLIVIILYEIGKILEEKSINSTRKSIANLMDIRPEYANLKHEHHEHKVNPQEVNIGDIIIIKQGEKIPLDGIVVSGNANLNTSSLTGETKLRKVNTNDVVLSGSINESGLIEVKVTEKYENSTCNLC